MLSVIIPALNAEGTIAKTLTVVTSAAIVEEVLVVDGGSDDRTIAEARGAGATVLTGVRGRGQQLALGAKMARGEWLLFLHADTELAPRWDDETSAFMTAVNNGDRYACFRFALDDDHPAARRIERVVAWRCRALGLPYGDQGLLLSRRLYNSVGGFGPLPLMEDVDLVRRLGRARLTMLDTPAVTSASRYQRDGYLRRPMRNLACLGLYLLGVPPSLIQRLYQ